MAGPGGALVSRRFSVIGLVFFAAAVLITGCAERSVSSRSYSAVDPNAPSKAAPPKPSTPARTGIAGRYAINGNSADVVFITIVDGHTYRVSSPGFWEGVGFFDGKVYMGVFRYPDDSKHGSLTKAVGTHRAVLQKDGSFKVHGSFSGEGFGEFDVEWKKL